MFLILMSSGRKSDVTILERARRAAGGRREGKVQESSS